MVEVRKARAVQESSKEEYMEKYPEIGNTRPLDCCMFYDIETTPSGRPTYRIAL